MNNTKLVIHLISDSTGETLRSVGAAAAAQFDNLDYEENVYPLIRSKKNLERVFEKIKENPRIATKTGAELTIIVALDTDVIFIL